MAVGHPGHPSKITKADVKRITMELQAAGNPGVSKAVTVKRGEYRWETTLTTGPATGRGTAMDAVYSRLNRAGYTVGNGYRMIKRQKQGELVVVWPDTWKD